MDTGQGFSGRCGIAVQGEMEENEKGERGGGKAVSGTSREAILRNIRRGLYGGVESSNASASTQDSGTISEKAAELRKKSYINNNHNILEQLVKELYNVNTEVYRAETDDEIRDFVIEIVRRKGIESFAAWESDYPSSLGLIGHLESEGLT